MKQWVLSVTLVAGAALAAAPALAQPHRGDPPPKPERSDKNGDKKAKAADSDGSTTQVDPKTGQKSKQYTFGGLDIDGKLKTPQLLYFLNRMKSEFDTTAPDKRSFIPELKRSTDEM